MGKISANSVSATGSRVAPCGSSIRIGNKGYIGHPSYISRPASALSRRARHLGAIVDGIDLGVEGLGTCRGDRQRDVQSRCQRCEQNHDDVEERRTTDVTGDQSVDFCPTR